MLRIRSRSVTTLLAAAAVLAAACSGDPTTEPTGEPTVDTFTPATDEPTASDTPTPTETATGDPFAIPEDPADIDVAYVQRLLEDAIYPVLHRTVLLQARADRNDATEPPQEVFDLLDAVYEGNQRTHAYGDISEGWEGGGFDNPFADDPQPAEVQVDRIDNVTEDCIVATFTVDFSPRLATPRDPVQLTALFKPRPEATDGPNPAPWVITQRGTTQSVSDFSCE